MSSKSLIEYQVEKFISQCQNYSLAKNHYYFQGLCTLLMLSHSYESKSGAVNYYQVLVIAKHSSLSRPYTLRLKT